MRALFLILFICLIRFNCSEISKLEQRTRSSQNVFWSKTRQQRVNPGCFCGVKKQNTRIVGGQFPHKEEWPWMAAICWNHGEGSCKTFQFCGGTLITNIHVLTAAHCVSFFKDPSLIVVSLRNADLSVDTESEHVTKEVSSILIHGRHESQRFRNDIAIITLSSPVEMSDTLLPACLPVSKRNQYAGDFVIATGYGSLYFGGPPVKKLREVQLRVLPNESCRNMGYPSELITERMVCAARSGKGGCQGDSGGPLESNERGRFELMGVTSFGGDCAFPGYPTVYTRVSSFLPWIKLFTAKGEYCEDQSVTPVTKV